MFIYNLVKIIWYATAQMSKIQLLFFCDHEILRFTYKKFTFLIEGKRINVHAFLILFK